jgi:hypothetical protein
VVLTLRDSGGGLKGQVNCDSDGWGNFGWRQFRDGSGDTIDIAPGDRVTVGILGWSQEVVAPDIGLVLDAATDWVHGSGPPNSFVEVYVRDAGPTLRVPTGPDMPSWPILRPDDLRPACRPRRDLRQPLNRPAAESPGARHIVWDNVDGWFDPVAVQHMYPRSTQIVVAVARPAGRLAERRRCGCDMKPGDRGPDLRCRLRLRSAD